MPDPAAFPPRPVGPSGLPVEVEDRITTAIPSRGGRRILACLRTARWLLGETLRHALPHDGDGRTSGDDVGDRGDGLRLAASATYNLREAFGSVVTGRDPAE